MFSSPNEKAERRALARVRSSGLIDDVSWLKYDSTHIRIPVHHEARKEKRRKRKTKCGNCEETETLLLEAGDDKWQYNGERARGNQKTKKRFHHESNPGTRCNVAQCVNRDNACEYVSGNRHGKRNNSQLGKCGQVQHTNPDKRYSANED
jgi:hypothetical protein